MTKLYIPQKQGVEAENAQTFQERLIVLYRKD